MHLNCLNWNGAQLNRFAPEGLDSVPMAFISNSIASLGFNCVRLPYSLESYFTEP